MGVTGAARTCTTVRVGTFASVLSPELSVGDVAFVQESQPGAVSSYPVPGQLNQCSRHPFSCVAGDREDDVSVFCSGGRQRHVVLPSQVVAWDLSRSTRAPIRSSASSWRQLLR